MFSTFIFYQSAMSIKWRLSVATPWNTYTNEKSLQRSKQTFIHHLSVLSISSNRKLQSPQLNSPHICNKYGQQINKKYDIVLNICTILGIKDTTFVSIYMWEYCHVLQVHSLCFISISKLIPLFTEHEYSIIFMTIRFKLVVFGCYLLHKNNTTKRTEYSPCNKNHKNFSEILMTFTYLYFTIHETETEKWEKAFLISGIVQILWLNTVTMITIIMHIKNGWLRMMNMIYTEWDEWQLQTESIQSWKLPRLTKNILE